MVHSPTMLPPQLATMPQLPPSPPPQDTTEADSAISARDQATTPLPTFVIPASSYRTPLGASVTHHRMVTISPRRLLPHQRDVAAYGQAIHHDRHHRRSRS